MAAKRAQSGSEVAKISRRLSGNHLPRVGKPFGQLPFFLWVCLAPQFSRRRFPQVAKLGRRTVCDESRSKRRQVGAVSLVYCPPMISFRGLCAAAQSCLQTADYRLCAADCERQTAVKDVRKVRPTRRTSARHLARARDCLRADSRVCLGQRLKMIPAPNWKPVLSFGLRANKFQLEFQFRDCHSATVGSTVERDSTFGTLPLDFYWTSKAFQLHFLCTPGDSL